MIAVNLHLTSTIMSRTFQQSQETVDRDSSYFQQLALLRRFAKNTDRVRSTITPVYQEREILKVARLTHNEAK